MANFARGPFRAARRAACCRLRPPAPGWVWRSLWLPEHSAPMNHENISQICFEDSYTVPVEQTARALFARLPHGHGYAERMMECLATGYLVAVMCEAIV